MLTNEDHLIFRSRASVQAQAALHKADRRDAQIMKTSELARWYTPAARALRHVNELAHADARREQDASK